MPQESSHEPRRPLSRRELFKRAGIVAAVTATPSAVLVNDGISQSDAAALAREALETLTRAEAATVAAIVARLLPADANGPGALEARADRYIDRALVPMRAHPLFASDANAFTGNLAALDAYAKATHGAVFAALDATRQDIALTTLEANTARGFVPDSRTFFNFVRNLTLQGTFGDPYYGGNANGVGWQMIGFPGIKLEVPASEQGINVTPKPGKKSTYDFDYFNPYMGAKKTAKGKGGKHVHH